MIKRIIFFLILINLISISYSDTYSQKLFEYFDSIGFINKTHELYTKNIDLNSLEKAAILSEIIQRVYKHGERENIPSEMLLKLQRIMNANVSDLLIISDMDIGVMNDRINYILREKSSATSEISGVSSGINAQDLLKRHIKSSGQKYYVVDDKNFPVVKDGNFFIKENEENSNRNSYLLFSTGQYQPTSTSFQYLDNDFYTNIGVGWKRNPNLGFEIRKMNYTKDDSGSLFFVPGSNYKFEYEPISFFIRYRLKRFGKFSTYAGYGVSRLKMEHTLTEPSSTPIKISETDYSAYVIYGIEYFEKQDFSMFLDVSTNITDSYNMQIKTRIYSIDPGNYTWSFGVKFYFE